MSPVPPTASVGLTPEQKRFYDENGYVLVKGMFTREEAARMRQASHDLAERLQKIRNIDATWATARSADSARKTAVYHCHDVQCHDAIFSRLIVDDRLTAAAASIIGPNVQLHHTKMFIKPPEKGSPFPMHQDVPYFPHRNHSMIAAIVHLDDAPVEKGCLRVYPGTHKLGVLKTDRPDFSLDPAQWSIEKATVCPAEAGDVLYFSYLTIHGSGLNVSSEARTTVLIQMRDPSDPPTVKTHQSRNQGMMLTGFDPTSCTCGLDAPAPAAPVNAAIAAPVMGGAKS